MSQKLKVLVENALTAYQNADAAGKKLLTDLFEEGIFEPVKITDQIKTFEDVLKVLNLNRTEVIPFSNPTNDYQKGVNALAMVTLIAKALNEGWVPNWADSNEYKYYPWFKVVEDKNTSSGFGLSYYDYGRSFTFTYVGSRLVYRTRELAEYAGKQFINVYQDSHLIGN